MAVEKNSGAHVTKMRIAKRIARSGLCSRRDAERLIADKRVAVDGRVLESAALDVAPEARVTVDGKPLPEPQPTRAWRYHKPKGRVTSHRDPEGRPTVFEALPEDMPRVVSVGRLDMNTEGLLLLTTDGELARHLELPATGWMRRYRVRAKGKVDQGTLDALEDGVTIDGVRYGAIEARLDKVQGVNAWLTVGLREGKNREVRRLMEHLGLTVNRLIRVSFGPFMLGELAPGQIEEIKPRVLGDQLGPELARKFALGSRAGHAKARQPERAKLPRRKAPARGARR